LDTGVRKTSEFNLTHKLGIDMSVTAGREHFLRDNLLDVEIHFKLAEFSFPDECMNLGDALRGHDCRVLPGGGNGIEIEHHLGLGWLLESDDSEDDALFSTFVAIISIIFYMVPKNTTNLESG